MKGRHSQLYCESSSTDENTILYFYFKGKRVGHFSEAYVLQLYIHISNKGWLRGPTLQFLTG